MTGVVRSTAGLDEDYTDMAGRLVGEQSKGAVGLELCHHVFGDKSRETGRTARQVVVVEGRIGSEVLKKPPSSGSFEEALEGREVAEARARRGSRGTEAGKEVLEHCPSDHPGVARIRAARLEKAGGPGEPGDITVDRPEGDPPDKAKPRPGLHRLA
jgi:hypothetical protein